MPTYEYECESCGYTFEIFQSMTDGVKRKCPMCAKMKLHRLIGAGGGILFKGSGFYCTDYKAATPSCGGANGEKKHNSCCSSCPAAKTDTKKDCKHDN